MKNSEVQCLPRWAILLALVVIVTGAMIGCGGNNGKSTPVAANATAVLVNMGDSPSDRVMALSMTVSAMNFTDSSGTSVAALSSPITSEMLHLMGTMQAVVMPKLPQGTYTQMSVTLSSALVTYLDPITHNAIQKTVSGPLTTSIPLNPPLTVGSSAMVMNLDMDVARSVSIDASGNVTMTPTFRPFANAATASATDPEHGNMMHLIGNVNSTSGNSFTMSTLSGMQFNMATSGATQFQGMGGMGAMGNGLILMVDAMLQPDGSINAKYVERMMSSGGTLAMGTVASVTGTPATQITLVPMDGIGSGMMPSVLANGIAVNVAGSTYSIDEDGVDMVGLPFTPEFDATHIFAGQLLSSSSASGMTGGGGMMGGGLGGMTNAGTQNASALQLELQGLNGTVTNYIASAGTATFTLTLVSDSAFSGLTAGTTSIKVFQQAGTQLRDITTVTNGANVHVRGLLFLDSGTYKLVATRIVAAQ